MTKTMTDIDFMKREARLEDRENARWRNYERDLMREKEEDERRARDREYWAKRLAEFDDEVEMERGEVDFYANRYGYSVQFH